MITVDRPVRTQPTITTMKPGRRYISKCGFVWKSANAGRGGCRNPSPGRPSEAHLMSSHTARRRKNSGDVRRRPNMHVRRTTSYTFDGCPSGRRVSPDFVHTRQLSYPVTHGPLQLQAHELSKQPFCHASGYCSGRCDLEATTARETIRIK